MIDSTLIVSVCMITYNHEAFISQAIEGVLMQKTNFPIELIIGEDCSTDSTREICIEYRNKYPDIIKLLLPEKNLGVNENGLSTLRACKGKYITLCEGDDYWIDKYKLQKQVDEMEKDETMVLCHTNGFRRIGKQISFWEEWPISGDVQQYFYTGCMVRTCTALFKSEFINEYLELFKKCNTKVVGEWPLFAFYSTKGRFGYLKEPMSVYRYNPTSVTSRKNLTSYYNYAFDIVQVKRFLRDHIFKGKLNDIYPENELLIIENYLGLRKAFDFFDYPTAKELVKFSHKSNKAISLSKYSSNKILFFIGCYLKKTHETIYDIIKKRK